MSNGLSVLWVYVDEGDLMFDIDFLDLVVSFVELDDGYDEDSVVGWELYCVFLEGFVVFVCFRLSLDLGLVRYVCVI